MTDLQALFHEIEQLSREELEELSQFMDELSIQRHQIRRAQGTPEERIAGLHVALEEFREGLSSEELGEIVAAMNYENKDAIELKAQKVSEEKS
jgi:Glu-tRNA(Gln) amidotransferase subunit E-like FAD-binding protein